VRPAEGASTHCVYCGRRPVTFAHIHEEDLHSSPNRDWRRVFCLCGHHHNGCYAQYTLSTEELLEAERFWIEQPSRRPKPDERDSELMRRESLGCEWSGKRWEPPPLLARFGSGDRRVGQRSTGR